MFKMDPQIRKRRVISIEVIPFDKTVNGDRTFKDPFTIKAIVDTSLEHEDVRTGDDTKPRAKLYIDAADGSLLSEKDEVVVPFLGRWPIKQLQPYYSLRGITQAQLWEVVL